MKKLKSPKWLYTIFDVTASTLLKFAKYLFSLLKYIIVIISLLALMVIVQLLLPQGEIELTLIEAIIFVVTGIIVMAVAIKATFNLY